MSQTKKDQIALLKRIALAGIPIEVSREPDLVSPHLQIQQLGDFMANRLTDLARGGSLYQIYVRVTCFTGLLYLKDVSLTTEWDETINVLSDPANDSGRQYYKLRDGGSFERQACVNHKLLSSQPLRRGDCIEGFLLAESMRQVPSSFPENCQLKALLAIFDQFDNAYPTQLVLALEHSKFPAAYSRMDRATHLERNTGLFAPRETAIRAGGIKRVDNNVQQNGTDDDTTLLQ